LAGLLDTDGHLHHNGFEYISKSEHLAEGVAFIARSLGLAAYQSSKIIHGVTYYRVYISGDCSVVPTRIPRKQANIRAQKKDVLRTGFTCHPTGTIEPFYGFTLDRDGRYLLDDFTVTHNSGKTITFAEIARRLGLTTLIIAHREELLKQAADKFHLLDPTAIIGQVGAGRHEWGAPITVASIQTISRPEHLKALERFGYQLVIIDECHHSAADGYLSVLKALSDAFLVGVTATPDRLDRQDIASIFGEPVFTAGIVDMVAQGHLCDLRAVAVKTSTSLDGLHTQAGDFKQDELEEVIDTEERNERVVKAYLDHASGRQALCFAVTVTHAEHLTETFTRFEIRAAMVCGETPPEERRRILHDYEQGEIAVLCNVGVLTEGYDAPQTSCIILARPTQSRALFVQCIGRGTRLAPGKRDCIILDITDNCLKHRLQPVTLSSALNKILRDSESVIEATIREEEEQEREKSQFLGEREQQERRAKVTHRAQDLLINLLAPMDWKRRSNGAYYLEVGTSKHRICLMPSDEIEGYYTVKAALAPDYEWQVWMADAPLEWAQQHAEMKGKLLESDEKKRILVDSKAPWRVYPASIKQCAFLHKLGIEHSADITAGDASDLIGKAIHEQNRQKAEKKLAKLQRGEKTSAKRGRRASA
jgi:superfamily II DNA or RNA helicase